jgi:hypothetical protein
MLTHLLVWLGVFCVTFILLQVSVAATYVIVRTLFPNWESAIKRLRFLSAKSTSFAVMAAERLPKILAWVLLAVFAILTVTYS